MRDSAPEVYAAITAKQEVFDEMAVIPSRRPGRPRPQHLSPDGRASTCSPRCTTQCRRVGVDIEFGRRIDDPVSLGECDLIVAADGAHSVLRSRLAAHFEPVLDERPNWLAWYGTTRLFDALSLIFRQTDDGLVIAHTYRSGTARVCRPFSSNAIRPLSNAPDSAG